MDLIISFFVLLLSQVVSVADSCHSNFAIGQQVLRGLRRPEQAVFAIERVQKGRVCLGNSDVHLMIPLWVIFVQLDSFIPDGCNQHRCSFMAFGLAFLPLDISFCASKG